MSYRLELRPSVRRKIIRWGLSDSVLVDVHLRLQALRQDPAQRLVRKRQPFDGMVCEFAMVDPENRLCEHYFAFLVV